MELPEGEEGGSEISLNDSFILGSIKAIMHFHFEQNQVFIPTPQPLYDKRSRRLNKTIRSDSSNNHEPLHWREPKTTIVVLIYLLKHKSMNTLKLKT